KRLDRHLNPSPAATSQAATRIMTTPQHSRWLLLTGRPGSGKTTVIRKALEGTPVKAGGFLTEEMRGNSVRTGFRIETLDGKRGVLARRDAHNNPPRVGSYSVDTSVMVDIAVPALREAANSADLAVIDEIGKMEMLCPAFVRELDHLAESDVPVLGTILMSPHPQGDRIKALPFVTLLQVTVETRGAALALVQEWLGEVRHCS
ncbi:MAG: nucleoside-triphosphatase, partial [Chloroflexota bacterium]